MLVNEPRENELNLEKIDVEIRMEKIRQNAAKLSWDGFGQSVRRNLLEKRGTLDADARLDVIQAISFMRKKIPVDESAPLSVKMKQLADSLDCVLQQNPGEFFLKNTDVKIEIGFVNEKITSCKIGYWETPLFDAEDAVKMLKNGEFSSFRDGIFNILGTLPTNVSPVDRNICKNALRAVEQHLVKEASDSSFKAINESNYGFFCPRTPLRPGRLYFVAEPMYVRNAEMQGKYHADLNDLNHLPYFEISFLPHERACPMPEFNQSGNINNWTMVDANVCVCLKFSHAMLFSYKTSRKLEGIIAKSPLIRHYTNNYRYMSGKENIKKNMNMTTRFPDGFIQHNYEIDVRCLTKENDPVIVEMYIKDLRQLQKIISILRSEWIHNSLWESMLAMTLANPMGKHKIENFVNMKTNLTRKCFEFVFNTTDGLLNVQLNEKADGYWDVVTITTTTEGLPITKQLDAKMTEKLNKSWNIPCTLVEIVTCMNCILSPCWMLSSQDEQLDMITDKMTSNCCIDIDKVGRAWLGCNLKTRTATKREDESELEEQKFGGGLKINGTVGRTYRRQVVDKKERGGLMDLFGEVDESLKIVPRSAKSSQNRRNQHATANVLSELERIRLLAEADFDIKKPMGPPRLPTPSNRRSLDGSLQRNTMMPPPMMRQLSHQPHFATPNGVGPGHHSLHSHHGHHGHQGPHGHHLNQMSPLETARLQMKQSMSAAQAVALASHTPVKQDMFDFPDEFGRSHHFSGSPSMGGYGSHMGGYGMGSPGGMMNHMGNMGSMSMQPPARGTTKTRRPRGRKAANMGDRVVDQMGMMQQPTTPTRGRGAGRKPRGAGRKVSVTGIPPNQMLDVMVNRPQMQRSYSDFPGAPTPMYNPTPPPKSNMYGDDDSDDECDPPPPPKTMMTPRRAGATPPINMPPQTFPMQSPTNQPAIPSPLLFPSKPIFAQPQQIHHHYQQHQQNQHQQQHQSHQQQLHHMHQQYQQQQQHQQHQQNQQHHQNHQSHQNQKEPQDIKPDILLLNQVMNAPNVSISSRDPPSTSSAASSATVPSSGYGSTPTTPTVTTPTKKKGMGLEAAISKIRGQQQTQGQQEVKPVLNQEQQNMNQQQSQQQNQQQPKPPVLKRISALNDIFDNGMSPSPPEKKPNVVLLQEAMASGSASATSSTSSTVPPADKQESHPSNQQTPNTEAQKLILKIPKLPRPSAAPFLAPAVVTIEKEKVEKPIKLTIPKDPAALKEKDRKRKEKEREKEKEKVRERTVKSEERERERIEKEKEKPKKRKHDRKEKDVKEPKEKKSKKEEKKDPINIMPTLSLKNFRIPKKETADEPPTLTKFKEDNREEPSSSSTTQGISSSSMASSSSGRKDSTSSQLTPSADYGGGGFGAFRDSPTIKKKNSTSSMPVLPPSGSIGGGGPGGGSGGGGGGRSSGRLPPPLPRNAPASYAQGLSGSLGSGNGPRGFPPSYYQQQKQVASYAQGIPPGHGPPTDRYAGSTWARPPNREVTVGGGSHYHGHTGSRGDRDRHDDTGPDSPEETSLRIADE